MTLGEFKAFIEGMDVAVAPTAAQWNRILDKIDQLEEPDKMITMGPYHVPTTLGMPSYAPGEGDDGGGCQPIYPPAVAMGLTTKPFYKQDEKS